MKKLSDRQIFDVGNTTQLMQIINQNDYEFMGKRQSECKVVQALGKRRGSINSSENSNTEKSNMNQLPSTSYLRLPQIIGNPKSTPPIQGLIPVSKSTWWDGVKNGRYPKPVKLSARTTAWSVEDIRSLIERMAQGD